MRPHRSPQTLVLILAALTTGLLGCPEDPNLDSYTFQAEDGLADALEDVGMDLDFGSDSSGPETTTDAAEPDTGTDVAQDVGADAETTECVPDCGNRCGPMTDGCGGECLCNGDDLCHPAGVCVSLGHEETVSEWTQQETMAKGAALVSTATWLAWVADDATGFLPHESKVLCDAETKNCAAEYQKVEHAPLGPSQTMQSTTLAAVDGTFVSLIHTQDKADLLTYSLDPEGLWSASLSSLSDDLQPYLAEEEELVQRTFIGASEDLWWASQEYSEITGESTTLCSGPTDLQDEDDLTVNETIFNAPQTGDAKSGCDLSSAFFVTTDHIWLPCAHHEGGGVSEDAASVEVRSKNNPTGDTSDILYPYEFFDAMEMGASQTERIRLLHVSDTHALFSYKADGSCFDEGCSTRLYHCAYEGVGTGTLDLFAGCSYEVPALELAFNLEFGMERPVFTANDAVAYLQVYDPTDGFEAQRALQPIALVGASSAYPVIEVDTEVIDAALSPDGRFLYWVTEAFGGGNPQRALKRALIQ